ncbi:hypothetical protein B0H11DRAFT_2066813 [Mycena galericulata]|nr:hypothetical protein B0H11DRAFT_2066813 [Mycena galericulata]
MRSQLLILLCAAGCSSTAQASPPQNLCPTAFPSSLSSLACSGDSRDRYTGVPGFPAGSLACCTLPSEPGQLSNAAYGIPASPTCTCGQFYPHPSIVLIHYSQLQF